MSSSQNEEIDVELVLEAIQSDIHNTALEKGWWDEHQKLKAMMHGQDDLDSVLADDLYIFSRVMLMVTELSEGIEARRNRAKDDKITKYDGLSVELADCMIRIFDLAGKFNLPVINAMLDKMEYNKTRAYKHGGKVI